VPGFVWTIIVFAVIAIFVIVSVYRIVTLAGLPVHLRWELAPVPGERVKGIYGGSHLEDFEWWRRPRRRWLAGQARYMAAEILLLRGVWRHNRPLWPLSFFLHAGVYLLFLTLLLIIVDAVLILTGTPAAGRGAFEGVVSWLALAGYLLGGLGALGLVIIRTFDSDLRPFSTFTSYFNLVLLAAVFTSGAYGWFSGQAFVQDLGLFTRGLVTPAGAAPPAPALAVHAAFFLTFLLYLPVSDMFHFAAKFFTYHEVRWDDRPVTAAMANKLAEQLGRPVGWSAAHVKAGGGRTWAEVVLEKPDHEEEEGP
jgi:nitrate reductase gamma subunit